MSGYDFLLDGDSERPSERNTPRVSGYGGGAYGGSGGRDDDASYRRDSSGMGGGFSGTPVASPFRANARSTGKPPRTSVLSSGRRAVPGAQQQGLPRGGASPRGGLDINTPGRNVRFAEAGGGGPESTQHTPYHANDGANSRAFTPGSGGGGGVRSTPFSLSGAGGFDSGDSHSHAHGGHEAARAGSTPFAGRSSGGGWDRRGSWGADGAPSGSNTPQAAMLGDYNNSSSSGSGGHGGYEDRDPLRSSRPDDSALAPAPAGLNHNLQDLEEVYQYWCLVIGLFPDNSRLDKLHDVFNSRGSVCAVKESTGNWALLKFTSPHEAARAAASHNGSFINSGTILAVTQLTTNIAQNMGLRLNEAGEFVGGAGGAMNDGTTFIEFSASGLGGSGGATGLSDGTGGLRSRWCSGVDSGAGAGADTGSLASTSVSPPRHPSGLRITTVSGDEIDPAAYLRPVRRQSVCDAILRWFGFQ